MMKRLITTLALATLPFCAGASTSLATQWGERAGDLYQQTARLIVEMDHGLTPVINDYYLLEVERFALTASRLSAWETQSGPAPQMACVLRDMAQQSVSQLVVLDAATSASAKREALRELAMLLMEAETVAQASIRPSLRPRYSTGCELALQDARF